MFAFQLPTVGILDTFDPNDLDFLSRKINRDTR